MHQNKRDIPLWLKISYTAMVVIIVPIYWRDYGITNFLWFSDIALILMVPALWLENRLIASMLAVGVMPMEFIWTLDFLCGGKIIGLAAYMFEDHWALYLRILSLFHIPLPIVIFYMIYQKGYDKRGLVAQSVLLAFVLPLTYAVTNPDENINWIFEATNRFPHLAPVESLSFMMAALLLLVYLPMHTLLKKIPLHPKTQL